MESDPKQQKTVALGKAYIIILSTRKKTTKLQEKWVAGRGHSKEEVS